ncbi:hypothetical protein EsDP_00003905 [Epichloe bromicola]|uniref:Pentatricopeptide repeat protein n=1 Tax=Epichloe bromicola TaxID=79588 RepID=A0ABQ0CQ48_9HYPO
MASPASDFQKLITEARERKKNSALADRIFSRDRRKSAPSKSKPTAGGSLASRVGVKKVTIPQQRAPTATEYKNARRASLPAGNVHGEWTHDLHDTVNGACAEGGPLSARITAPGASNSNMNGAAKNHSKRKSKLAAALTKMDVDQVNVVSPPARAASGMGITIRGLAGPYAVMGQNFAPGTTAADIESAMMPVGGELVSCTVVKTVPFLVVEMVFASREGGQRVIDTFNNKTADGRVIKMYPKVGGYKPPASQRNERNEPPADAPSGPKNTKTAHRDQIVDGSMGFPDLMNTDARNNSAGNSRLYSDKMVGGNRRGRGLQRG